MKDYPITLSVTQLSDRNALLNTMQAQLKTLQSFGFEAALKFNGNYPKHFKIAKGDEIYADDDIELLTHELVCQVARFTERVSVQHALDSMLPRMASIGWDASLVRASMLSDEKIEVKQPNGKTSIYSLTNAEMLQLRQALDIAETDWIIGDKIPLFQRVGWTVQMANEGGYYIVRKPGGECDTIAVGRVDQAKATVASAMKALSAKETEKAFDVATDLVK